MSSLTLETTDLGEAEALLREQYSLTIDPPRAGMSFRMRFTSEPLDALSLTRTRFAMEFSFAAVEPMAETIIAHLRRGELAYQIGEDDNRWTVGDVCVTVPAGAMWEAVVRDCDVHCATIPTAAFTAVAQAADGAQVALTGYRPVSARAAKSWVDAFEFGRQVTSQPDTAPLVRGATARLLAATALATFPNNALLDPTIEDRHDAHPPTVRRAIAFIESHPDLDLSVADIAGAAFVTPRALQLAFRRHLDSTPLSYLRRVRLERAHADLQAADPDTGTVTEIAARWGWARPSRFAADYRAAYGRHPHETLRS